MLPQKTFLRDRNFYIIQAVTLMAVMGVSSISPAFPRIMEALNISETEVGLLIVAFTIPGVVMTPFIGVLADRVGRKRLLVPSLFLFSLAGSACALVTEFNILIALRVVQGFGAAALTTLNLTVLGDLYQGERRAAALGLNASVLNVGIAAYPLLGGALAVFAWNYPFLLPLLAIPVGFFTLFGLKNPEPRSRENLREYLGSAWSYLKNIKVAGAFTAGVVYFIVLYGPYQTYLSLYLDDAFGASSFIIGVVLSSMAVTSALVSSQLGKIVRLISVPDLVKLGFVLEAVSLALVPFLPGAGFMLISTFIVGLAMGVLLPGLMTYIASVPPLEYRAVMMSINSAMLRLGQTLGPLIFGLVYLHADFKGVFLYGAALALLAAVVGFVGAKVIR
jgi:ACDE family multidrug resistance protein